METTEVDKELDDLETRMERLRALYEQYFLGIEKMEPTIPRKEVERKIQLLRRAQIRNTAMRFKFQMLIQRYNTHQQYWARVAREIETGTFRRDVMRAAARFGEKEALTILGKKRAKAYKALAEKQAARTPKRPDDHLEELGEGDLIEEIDVEHEEPEPVAPRAAAPPPAPSAAKGPPPRPSQSAAAPKVASEPPKPNLPEPDLNAAAPKQEPAKPVEPPKPSLDEVRKSKVAALAAAMKRKPAVEAQPKESLDLDLDASPMGGPEGGPPKPPRAATAASKATAAKPPPSVRPAPKAAASKPPPKLDDLDDVTLEAKPAPKVTAPKPPPKLDDLDDVTLEAKPAPKVTTPKPAPRAVEPKPAPKVAEPKAAPEAPGAIADQRLRQIYSQYVDAKRAAQESTAGVTFDKLAAKLRTDAERLKQKHPNRSIDYEVVMKDGKPTLKPVVK